MVLYIKNMVCLRCKIVVKNIIESLGYTIESVAIGEVLIKETLQYNKLKQLDTLLRETELELVFDKKSMLDQKIKEVIFETILSTKEPLKLKFSCYLANRLEYSYTYLSNVFSEVNAISIEQYIILHKIERVKGLLISDNACLSEIAYQMNYSSVGHLSAQFKKVTGFTAKDYKLMRRDAHARRPVMMAV